MKASKIVNFREKSRFSVHFLVIFSHFRVECIFLIIFHADYGNDKMIITKLNSKIYFVVKLKMYP